MDYSILSQIDAAKLFAIAWRLVSEETVQEAREFTGLVAQAAELVTKSALRIAGIAARGDADQDRALVERIVEEYQA